MSGDGNGSVGWADGFTDNLVSVSIARVEEMSGTCSWESEDTRRMKSTLEILKLEVDTEN